MKETKEIKMTPIVGAQENTPSEKMSYEQMVNIANQLQGQNRDLMMRMQNLADIYHRLDYLFKVLESSKLFDSDFISRCVTEVQDIMTIPTEEDTKEEPKKD